MTPLRLGVIGCGRIAQVAHLPAIAKSAAVELVAVSDPSTVLAEGVGRRYGVASFTDTARLLELDRLDAVVIAVPDRYHGPLTRQALEAGRHVLLEKPAATTSVEAAELEELAKARSLLVQIGAMRRHDPGLQYAHDAVDSIGDLLTATFWYRLPTRLRASTEAALFPPTVVDDQVRSVEAGFKADRRTYLLRTHGAHVFDTVRYLLGEVIEVQAALDTAGADLCWNGALRTSCVRARFDITANVHGEYAEGIDLFGSAGQISVRAQFPFYRKASQVGVFHEQQSAWTTPEYGAADPYQRQVEAFAAAVRDGGGVDPDAHDGVEALRIIEAVHRSTASDGATVPL